MKILLLESDEYYHQQFADRLGSRFEIIPARDVPAAEALLEDMRPDFVVAELLLADGASFAFLENLRRSENSSSMPIIVFSRIYALEDIEHTLSLGISGYFVKGKDTINDIKKLLLSLENDL